MWTLTCESKVKLGAKKTLAVETGIIKGDRLQKNKKKNIRKSGKTTRKRRRKCDKKIYMYMYFCVYLNYIIILEKSC